MYEERAAPAPGSPSKEGELPGFAALQQHLAQHLAHDHDTPEEDSYQQSPHASCSPLPLIMRSQEQDVYQDTPNEYYKEILEKHYADMDPSGYLEQEKQVLQPLQTVYCSYSVTDQRSGVVTPLYPVHRPTPHFHHHHHHHHQHQDPYEVRTVSARTASGFAHPDLHDSQGLYEAITPEGILTPDHSPTTFEYFATPSLVGALPQDLTVGHLVDMAPVAVHHTSEPGHEYTTNLQQTEAETAAAVEANFSYSEAGGEGRASPSSLTPPPTNLSIKYQEDQHQHQEPNHYSMSHQHDSYTPSSTSSQQEPLSFAFGGPQSPAHMGFEPSGSPNPWDKISFNPGSPHPYVQAIKASAIYTSSAGSHGNTSSPPGTPVDGYSCSSDADYSRDDRTQCSYTPTSPAGFANKPVVAHRTFVADFSKAASNKRMTRKRKPRGSGSCSPSSGSQKTTMGKKSVEFLPPQKRFLNEGNKLPPIGSITRHQDPEEDMSHTLDLSLPHLP
ncbi:unnamed protein product [Notodromas monacha]|uniref:Uncharacterized protein n=1 Tax=Notodromas monacha TaxID=399045 RepID=A0A7R9BCP9_9CRUS|nr:unnamed protein product [Notodromas monacha]CAG0912914.1 unnamed protein product [Notodromas monacha]